MLNFERVQYFRNLGKTYAAVLNIFVHISFFEQWHIILCTAYIFVHRLRTADIFVYRCRFTQRG